MIFRKVAKAEDRKERVVYLLAERMIREAIRKGSHIINIGCHPKERFFANQSEFLDMIEEDEDSPIQLRNRGWVLGISKRENGRIYPI